MTPHKVLELIIEASFSAKDERHRMLDMRELAEMGLKLASSSPLETPAATEFAEILKAKTAEIEKVFEDWQYRCQECGSDIKLVTEWQHGNGLNDCMIYGKRATPAPADTGAKES